MQKYIFLILILLNITICIARLDSTQNQLRRYRKKKSAGGGTRNATTRSEETTLTTEVDSLLWKQNLPSIVRIDSFQKGSLLNKRMCFYSNSACERGTEIAMFDYAHYVETMFGMNSYIIFPRYLENANQWTDVRTAIAD
jgi:hypothetical protein